MKAKLVAMLLALSASAALANDWEKFYRPFEGSGTTLPSSQDPEIVSADGDPGKTVETMWRRGYGPIGASEFNSPNAKTADAIRFAKKLKARYVVLETRLASSTTSTLPLTMPHTTTSVTNGNASVNGSGGYATGTYSGTTTTYGSQTTYIPITINRFDKLAVYFGEVPKFGLGIMSRELASDELALVQTNRAIAVRYVRDESPAFLADILPGDILTQFNGEPIDRAKLSQLVAPGNTLQIHLFRRGQQKDVQVKIPADWHTP
ncbi:MAG: PDZ domain-containing protein [Sphingomonadales bacterium]|nr:PDZ domain-containing protein [Sphingomonadales bacterium]